MRLRDFRESLLSMPYEKALQLIYDMRQRRRTPRKRLGKVTLKVKQAKETKAQQLAFSLSTFSKEDLLRLKGELDKL